jgi:hypothetical protein
MNNFETKKLLAKGAALIISRSLALMRQAKYADDWPAYWRHYRVYMAMNGIYILPYSMPKPARRAGDVGTPTGDGHGQ